MPGRSPIPTTVPTEAATTGPSGSIIDVLTVLATLAAGGIAVYARYRLKKYRIEKGIKSEIAQMEGVKRCKSMMEERDRSPTDTDLEPSELPPPQSMPTNIYESNTDKIGMMSNVERVISFYTELLRYKAIIKRVREGEEVPKADQEDLYDRIGSLEDERQGLFGDGWVEEYVE
ncbi:hypothetical protein [Halobaculum sp. MBLA0143]|uniref:hypothetical protein n=1 Tax=Halobaculum sp. MBLA0143 TaxID=3079933 RepID=UPI003523B548